MREAERLAAEALAGDPPDAVAEELRDLFEQVSFRRHLALRGIELRPAEVQMSMFGRAVGFGIVESDRFVDRVKSVEAILVRTAERRRAQSFRETGPPRKEIRDAVDLFVSVPRAASFAVTFRLGMTPSLLPEARHFGEELVDELLACVKMLDAGDFEGIRARMPDASYYRNFMGLARKIAPDGQGITGIGFTALGRSGELHEVALRRPQKQFPEPGAAPKVPVTSTPSPPLFDDVPVNIKGRLRYADAINQDSEIRLDSGDGDVYLVRVPKGLMADIVRPLWDERVIIKGLRRADGSVLLQDIEKAGEE